MSLRIAEQYVQRFGYILQEVDASVLPADVAQIKSFLESVGPVYGSTGTGTGSGTGTDGRTGGRGGGAHRQGGGA
jgi:hypothetical protein